MQRRCSDLAAVIRFATLNCGVLFLLALPSPSAAQQATVVQLPTFSFFTVNTTVSVPDSGGAFSGGERRFSSGHTAFGPALGVAPRPWGRHAGARAVPVGATVHDFEAMDKRVLELAGPLQVPHEDPLARRLIQARASSAGRAPPGSLADARRRRSQRSEAANHRALADLETGRKAEADGKPGAALIYYKMAAGRATGELKTQIAAEIRRLSQARR